MRETESLSRLRNLPESKSVVRHVPKANTLTPYAKISRYIRKVFDKFKSGPLPERGTHKNSVTKKLINAVTVIFDRNQESQYIQSCSPRVFNNS